ncbi:sucrase ferredoxin [Pedococcus sp. KACC 23699]|uniref:Sucrase ferredoxin n=1 Tax=Pedococcus sp. KACC 23699 TaxID=3149228 RepID=A0AAU7JRW6_9MICO
MPTSGHGVPAPDACSVGFDRAEVSTFGTAAQATFFVALEQPGPWGREAATQSHLPVELGAALAESCSSRGGRLSLIRRPGRHPDDGDDPAQAGHTAYLAWAGEQPWLLRARVTDPAVLLEVDLDALARGDRDAVASTLDGAASSAPVLLVCTNGRRDVCCAVRGRPVALDAAAISPGRVWEASHTGGHRFAPTGVLLPHGATLARLDVDLATAVLTAADGATLPPALLGPIHDRGRSALSAGAQAAESHVRHLVGEISLTALSTAEVIDEVPDDGRHGAGSGRFTVSHRDGRSWSVRCEKRLTTGELPESCGKPAVPLAAWAVSLLS